MTGDRNGATAFPRPTPTSTATQRVCSKQTGHSTPSGSAIQRRTRWHGAVATDPILDSKGDLAAATGADTAAKVPVGTNGQVLTADSTQTAGMHWATPSGGGGGSTVARVVRSSNTVLSGADVGKLFDCQAAFTQTLTAAATLAAGWWCYIRNDTVDGTTILVVDPNGSETIDGNATLTMYSGDTRLLVCDGSNFFTTLLEGGDAKYVPGSYTWAKPPGATRVSVVCVGGGGGGGGGRACSGQVGTGGLVVAAVP